jgi:hypothetical protein
MLLNQPSNLNSNDNNHSTFLKTAAFLKKSCGFLLPHPVAIIPRQLFFSFAARYGNNGMIFTYWFFSEFLSLTHYY